MYIDFYFHTIYIYNRHNTHDRYLTIIIIFNEKTENVYKLTVPAYFGAKMCQLCIPNLSTS